MSFFYLIFFFMLRGTLKNLHVFFEKTPYLTSQIAIDIYR